jgi:hypothetical protein
VPAAVQSSARTPALAPDPVPPAVTARHHPYTGSRQTLIGSP